MSHHFRPEPMHGVVQGGPSVGGLLLVGSVCRRIITILTQPQFLFDALSGFQSGLIELPASVR